MKKVIQLCREKVTEIYAGFDASHDLQHIDRVLVNAKKIMKTETAIDPELIEIGILLHDIDDPKYEREGITARALLESFQLPTKQIREILQNIEAVSFSGGNEKVLPSVEAAIMRDADRLDAIGAVGIARAFVYGGAKGHKLYNIAEIPRDNMTVEAYRRQEIAVVTHFHEKLLKVKDLMVTAEGKRLAKERHRFMEQFLRQLAAEIEEK